MQVKVNRRNLRFYPDAARVIARFLWMEDKRSKRTIDSASSMSEQETTVNFNPVLMCE